MFRNYYQYFKINDFEYILPSYFHCASVILCTRSIDIGYKLIMTYIPTYSNTVHITCITVVILTTLIEIRLEMCYTECKQLIN